jgi:outer membrane protein assembly factor BamD (BamD/ComL family)
MNRPHRLRAFFCAALLASAAASFEAQAQSKGDTVRPEVGKPLQEAQGLSRAGKHREALAKVNEAEAAANKTANESFLIQRMRGSVATAAGDNDTAVKAFEAVLNSGRVTGRDATQLVQAVAVAHYKNKDYAKSAQWTQRYFKEGGSDPAMRAMLLQSYYLGNDCASVNRVLGNVGAEENGKKPTEEELQILANCFLRQKDTGGYVNAIEKLVIFYPKKEYWTDLLSRVQKKPGFSDRLAQHVYRLRLATNNVNNANDYMEAAQLAVQAGVPAEAKAIIDKGYAAKILGEGKEGERHGRLRDLVNRNLEESRKNRANDEKEALAAKDGNGLVTVGLNYAYEGNAQKGLQLVEQGIRKGGLKRPEDAKLRLGEAQIQAGQKARGVQTLREVKGNDGTADIARLWILHARV